MAGTARRDIVEALVDLLKQVNGAGNFTSNLFGNVEPRLIFWDEVKSFPTVSVVSGNEAREYLPGGFKWGFLDIAIKIYVRQENAKGLIERIFYDIENLLDTNIELSYGHSGDATTDINILSIEDDQGLLEPEGVGDMIIQVRYQIK
jgi:hypothetical protein